MSSKLSRQTRVSNEQHHSTVHDQCSECGGELIHDETTHGVYCEDCGAVIQDRGIDTGPEWRRSESLEESPKRTGTPLKATKHDWGLSTTISYTNKDANGNTISGRKIQKINRLRKWQKRNSLFDPENRSLKNCLTEISRMGTALGIPESTIEIASMIQRQSVDKNLMVGYSIESVSTASLYAACRRNHISRSFEEFKRVSRVSKKKIRRAYMMICRELNLQIPPATPREFIPRFCTKLDLPRWFEKEAKHLQEEYCKKANISGKSPVSIAASSIYAAGVKSNQLVPQSAISEETGASIYAIRANFTEILECDDELDLSTYNSNGQHQKHPAQIVRSIHGCEKSQYLFSDYGEDNRQQPEEVNE